MISKIAELLADLFETRGRDQYFSEPVSQIEHALQSAFFARRSGAEPSLIIAALLHDVGHLLHGDETIACAGVDARHEIIGSKWLKRYFGPEVTEPIALHVAAKRYLCAIDPGYQNLLSEASIQSLTLQGGPFSSGEAREFASNKYFREAVNLRRWDDQAKVPDMVTPGLDSYFEILQAYRIDSSKH